LQPRLVLNSRCPYLSLPSAGFTGMHHHHAWQRFSFPSCLTLPQRSLSLSLSSFLRPECQLFSQLSLQCCHRSPGVCHSARGIFLPSPPIPNPCCLHIVHTSESAVYTQTGPYHVVLATYCSHSHVRRFPRVFQHSLHKYTQFFLYLWTIRIQMESLIANNCFAQFCFFFCF
jgi:hypothetical protein